MIGFLFLRVLVSSLLSKKKRPPERPSFTAGRQGVLLFTSSILDLSQFGITSLKKAGFYAPTRILWYIPLWWYVLATFHVGEGHFHKSRLWETFSRKFCHLSDATFKFCFGIMSLKKGWILGTDKDSMVHPALVVCFGNFSCR